MIDLYGHGYLGNAIADELLRSGIPFNWRHHGEPPTEYTVINAAGYTGDPNVDACEHDKFSCMQGNIEWPVWLQQPGCSVIHIGSGCVYSGFPARGYTEDDEPNFVGSFYSATKAMEQRMLAPYLKRNSYLLRIRMPFSGVHHRKNLLDKLASYKTLVNHVNSMTRLEDAARVAVWFVVNKPKPGIYNVVNPGAISTSSVAAMMGLNPNWFDDESAFRATVIAPRSRCVLSSAKLNPLIELPCITNAMLEATTEWRKS